MDALTNTKFLAASLGRWGASQGWYYKAINATPGTGIVSATTTAFSATAALVEFQNTANTGSNVFSFPDYVKLIVSVADVESAAGSLNVVASIDNKLRFSSGGTQVVLPGTYANNYGPVQAQRIGPANIVTNGPQTAIFAGALVLNAESGNVVRTARSVVKVGGATNFGVVGDEYILTFATGNDAGAGSAKTGTTAAIYRQNLGFASIAPQSSLALHFWCPNITTGVTVEVDVGWFEAPTT
jgi:hypothetical protein